MELTSGTYCPLIKEDCIGLKCAWFGQVRGVNPNTGKEVDEWACAISWLPVLLIENSQQQRQTGAAVESARNVFAESVSEIGRAVFAQNVPAIAPQKKRRIFPFLPKSKK